MVKSDKAERDGTATCICTIRRFKHTDNMINRLIRGAFETSVFATIFCAYDMAMFFAESGNNLHSMFVSSPWAAFTPTRSSPRSHRCQAHREALAASEHRVCPGAGTEEE